MPELKSIQKVVDQLLTLRENFRQSSLSSNGERLWGMEELVIRQLLFSIEVTGTNVYQNVKDSLSSGTHTLQEIPFSLVKLFNSSLDNVQWLTA